MAAAVPTKPAIGGAEQDQQDHHDSQPPLLVPLPPLLEPYSPCTFDYEASATPNGVSLREWIDVFRHSIPTFSKHIELSAHENADAAQRSTLAQKFAADFSALLDAALEARRQGRDGPGVDPQTGRVSCIALCHLRDGVLHKLGFRDIFADVKASEDRRALALLPGVLSGLDAAPAGRARLELAVRGVLAGNVFDLGAAASAELFASGKGGGAEAFSQTRNSLLPRPWAVDDLDALLAALLGAPSPSSPPPYDKVVMFVDNSGSDVVLGMLPLARELLRLGVPSVVLAANARPTLNDTTAAELDPLLKRAVQEEADPDATLLPAAVASGALRVVSSGSGLPVADLRLCSRELAAEFSVKEGKERVLLVLEGMGRGIETNLRASFSCDALRIGVIKHPEVARVLGGRLYDPVVRFTRGGRG